MFVLKYFHGLIIQVFGSFFIACAEIDHRNALIAYDGEAMPFMVGNLFSIITRVISFQVAKQGFVK